MRRLIHPIKNNSLSIVLFALFAICISAQSFAGWRLQNETFAAHGQAPVGYWRNLSSGTFLEGLATNWQAAFLQLASLIIFSGFLYQRGAPHSRDPTKPKNEPKHREEAGRFSWLYRHSLFLAFVALFALSLALDVVVGDKPTTRYACSGPSRLSPSRHFCFRLSSGRQPLTPGRRSIWRSRSLSCSAYFCVSRTRRSLSRSSPATKELVRRTNEQ